MKRILTMVFVAVLIPGCSGGTVERSPVRAADTALISCEAAQVTILAEPSGRVSEKEGGYDEP